MCLMCFVVLIPDLNIGSSNDDNIDKTVDDGKLLPSRSVTIVIALFLTLYRVMLATCSK